MKKIMCTALLLLVLTSCSNRTNIYNLKSVGSVFVFKRDMITYSLEFKYCSENVLVFDVNINNNTDKDYPLYIKYSDYISSVIINNTTTYDTAQYIWYFGDIEYEDDYFNMMIKLSDKGKEEFNSKCDIDMSDSYIPNGLKSHQKIHYIEIILDI